MTSKEFLRDHGANFYRGAAKAESGKLPAGRRLFHVKRRFPAGTRACFT